MRESLRYRSKWRRFVILPCLMSFCLLMQAQTYRVAPHKTISVEAAGVTAAYSLDETLAEAVAENGIVMITGILPGTTHVVAIAPSGVQSFELLVTQAPLNYPPGFRMPASLVPMAESGYFEARYYSSPAQIQSQIDLLKVHGDDRTHVHLVETSLMGPVQADRSRTELSSVSYQIVTARRDITLFDFFADESPLTLNGSIIRGFHMRQSNWFVHAGYTSVATFQGLFLPLQPEFVAGGGYLRRLTANSSVTASFYRISRAGKALAGSSAHPAGVVAISYKYTPSDNFRIDADAGFSHGVAGAFRLSYKTGRDNIVSLVRYLPPPFASVSANNVRGFHTDLSWTRHVSQKLDTTLTFYNNNLVLPDLRESTLSVAAGVHYEFTRNWAVTGGAIASNFQSKAPLVAAVKSFTLPAGLVFQSKHLGVTGQYQFAATPGREKGGSRFRSSLRMSWGTFSVNAYAERDTDAPTLSFILGQVAGLQQDLNLQGLRATTVQQVDELLAGNAFLIAAGYIRGATINLVPVRAQLGGTADWTSRGTHPADLSYGFLLNDNHLLGGTTQETGHTLSYSQSVTQSDDFSLSCSVVGVKDPGIARSYAPVCFIAWRHQIRHVPYFVVPERRGTITGHIFRDDRSGGVFEPGMRPMPEVDVMLDDSRHTLSLADGSYRFAGVPRGRHKVVAVYRSREPFFFTTVSALDVDEVARVDFGISYSKSGLLGRVLSDAGDGLSGIGVVIGDGGIRKWSALTEGDGSFFVSSLEAGEYTVEIDEESLPVGYAEATTGEPRRITVGVSAPGIIDFTLRAYRSITGRVVSYDPARGQYMPVEGAEVRLSVAGLTSVTDAMGTYLFNNLAAGNYSISLPNVPLASPVAVLLGSQPAAVTGADFHVATDARRR